MTRSNRRFLRFACILTLATACATNDDETPKNDAGTETDATTSGSADATIDAANDASDATVSDASAPTDAGPDVIFTFDAPACHYEPGVVDAGGSLTALAHDVLGLKAFAVDGTNAYWMNSADGKIRVVDIASATQTTEISLARPLAFFAGWDHVSSNGASIVVRDSDTRFSTVDVDAGQVVLGQGPAFLGSVVVGANDIFFGTTRIVDGGFVNDIRAMPLAVDAGSTTLVRDQATLSGLWVDSNELFWITPGTGNPSRILSAPIADASSPAVVVSESSDAGSPIVRGLAADATHVYFTHVDPTEGDHHASIRKVARGGGSATTIVSGLDAPVEIRVDNTNIYWIDHGTRTIGAGSRTSKLMTAPKTGGSATTIAEAYDIDYFVMNATDVVFAEERAETTNGLCVPTITLWRYAK